MLFAVLFTDAKDAPPDLRKQYMAAHLAFLTDHADQIKAAGPLHEGPTGAGGLWLVEAADEAGVDNLVKADPFWTTGLRDSHRILRWTQVFADGRPTV